MRGVTEDCHPLADKDNELDSLCLWYRVKMSLKLSMCDLTLLDYDPGVSAQRH